MEKLPRPTFALGMPEAAWEFKTVQWKGYTEQVEASDSQKLQQLQAACTPDLQRIYDAGSYATLTSTTLLMNKMEKIAVVMVHKALHIMNMWNMTHQSDESIRGFAASITGIADLCGMILECTS